MTGEALELVELPYIIGFSGTHFGTTGPQREQIERLLTKLISGWKADLFIHGCCVGADEEAARIARHLGLRIVGMPGRKPGTFRRSSFRNDVELSVPDCRTPELTRNRRLAKAARVLIVCPRTETPSLRSGTRSTVRAALKVGTDTIIVLPDGQLRKAVVGPRPVGVVLEPIA